jgi:hypothetical protein
MVAGSCAAVQWWASWVEGGVPVSMAGVTILDPRIGCHRMGVGDARRQVLVGRFLLTPAIGHRLAWALSERHEKCFRGGPVYAGSNSPPRNMLFGPPVHHVGDVARRHRGAETTERHAEEDV